MIQFLSKIRSIEGISITGLIAITLNIILLHNPIIGFLAFLAYSLPLSYTIGQRLFSSSKGENFILGFLLFFSEIILSGTLVYYLFEITPFISYFLLLIPALTLFFLPKIQKTPKNFSWEKISISRNLILPLIITFLDLILLIYLSLHGTYDLSASPWLQTSPIFFLIYFITTVLLFFQYKSNQNEEKKSTLQNTILTSLHFFVGIAVAAFIYPLGYGFDAFIHRATQQWIQTHGFILPKQPYYVGQYSLVVFLSNITQIKIFFIDVFLVPIFAAIFIPSILSSTIKKLFPTKNSLYSSLAFWILPFIPFLSLHLTTPHNLVLLLTILLVFLAYQYISGHISFLLPLLVAISTLGAHPLIGAPNILFIFAIFLFKKFAHNKILENIINIATTFGIALLLPLLFTLNALRSGKSLPHFDNPFTHISNFFELFKDPYWYANTSPIHFELLYTFERLIVPSILFLVCAHIFFSFKQGKSQDTLHPIFFSTAIGLFFSAFLLRSWIVFPDVVAYEQGDYPMRLIHTSIIFLLPFAMYGFIQLCEKILSVRKQFENLFTKIFIIILAITLTLCLYLSYPQRNIKVRFPGYNVTQSDFHAAKWIHEQNNEYNYIVLSNQLVSAAALTDYSFVKYFDTVQGPMFYYAIPTGGTLYQYYGKMIYEGQKPEYMQEAMNVAGVQKAYFVVNKYWANSDKIIREASKTADKIQIIDDNIWIFEYNRNILK